MFSHPISQLREARAATTSSTAIVIVSMIQLVSMILGEHLKENASFFEQRPIRAGPILGQYLKLSALATRRSDRNNKRVASFFLLGWLGFKGQ